MITESTILAIGSATITFLILMSFILYVATRHHSNAPGNLALVIVVTTVPVYVYNTARSTHSAEEYIIILMYIACIINTMLSPLLWIFVHSIYKKHFQLKWRNALQFIPTLVSFICTLIFYLPLTHQEFMNELELQNAGHENFPAIINDIVVFGQLIIYFPLMFRFLYRKRRELLENYSDSEYLTTKWILRFVWLFFFLFIILFVAYIIDPRTDAWLIPILNVMAMGYLTYHIVAHPTIEYINRLPDTKEGESSVAAPTISLEEMKETCIKVTTYLSTSCSYRRCDLSLAMLSHETNIPQKTLSRSINGYLNRNFFEFINEMRVEEAKRNLLNLSVDEYKIDSIYESCGFRTRSTFFLAFKKVEGKSPAQWLKSVKNEQ